MSLLELTLRNVKRSFRLYSIYLFSMITGVIIQYTFSSLMFNEDVLGALQNRDNFQLGAAIASAAVFLFVILFILYANSFFMRQRKKEFGMYLLYGLTERQVVRMLFYETVVIGLISLVAGVLLGGLLSKLFGMLLMRLMEYDTAISLLFPVEAIAATGGLFLLLAVIIGVQSYRMVNRLQLTELFHAKAKAEKAVRVSAWLAITAVVMLAVAFALLYSGKGSVFWQEYASASLIATAIGIVGGTYLFFRQFVGWILQRIGRSGKYHEGNTVLWTSSLRFQIRGNTLNLSFITLFGAAIMMLMCFMAINYKVQFEAVGRNLPNDIAFQSLSTAENEEIDGIIRSSAHNVEYRLQPKALVTAPVTDREMAFENAEMFMPEVLLVAQSTFNEAVTARGDDEQVKLKGNEAVTLSQGSDFPKAFAPGETPRFTVKPLLGEEETASTGETEFTLVEKKDYAYLGWSTNPATSMDQKPAVLVVSDEEYERLKQSGTAEREFIIYGLSDANSAVELSIQVHSIVSRTEGAYYSSFADVYSKQIEGSSLMLFSSGFLALIATFALASVIYFKQLREATDEQQQYAILRKIGVDNRQIKSVIRKQLLFVFLPPLLLSVLYSWSIIKSYILDSVSDFPELPGLVWGIIGAYFAVYLLFYVSSANLYYKIISRRS
ncbi:ABC transporter permease [Paenibacillus pasadenensis]|uniref:ABC transporter permease n=1 Tax=Paenibacillus pasadenensis TaxID=217090 RepID=UPI0020401C2A|nr:ABC transporter permease [Paenibacillus pasadenensis]MCM3747876.1 ABC transporter permease [Paenibacillus pasadenensis]